MMVAFLMALWKKMTKIKQRGMVCEVANGKFSCLWSGSVVFMCSSLLCIGCLRIKSHAGGK